MGPGIGLAFDEEFGIGGGAELQVNATQQKTGPLPPGRYAVWASADCWVLRGAGTETITKSATGASFLAANTYFAFHVTPRDLGDPTHAARNVLMCVDAGGTTPGVFRVMPISRRESR